MSYTPINWQTGDVITAEKLNKMDNGWGVENTQIFSETVTTVAGQRGNEATLTYSEQISYDTIVVAFNGTEYICNRIEMFGGSFYGGMGDEELDFSEYPFCIESMNNQNKIYTANAGTHTVEANMSTVEVSASFERAVKAIDLVVTLGTTTWQEVFDALNEGRECYVFENEAFYAAKKPILFASRLGAYNAYGINVSQGSISVVTYSATTADGVLTSSS